MKGVTHSIFFLLSTVVIIFGCTKESYDDVSEGNVRVIASIGNNYTKVNLSPAEYGTYDLSATWRYQEKLIPVLNNGRYTVLEPTVITDISEDKKVGSFYYNPGKSFTYPSTGYQLLCFTENCGPKVIDDEVYYNASIYRSDMDMFQAPMYAKTTVIDDQDFKVHFGHYMTYELLHVRNTSGDQVSFNLIMFQSPDSTWYNTKGALCERTGTFVNESEAAKTPITESGLIYIPKGGNKTIISAYIPIAGKKISNATLVAEINGETKTSSNTKSSNIELKRGHAYHMYAEWDGKELRFVDGFDDPEPDPNAEYVDLGLPSGTLWAKCNLGAKVPEEYGDYYAWGETQPMTSMNMNFFEYTYTGNDVVLPLSADAAHVQLGGNWRIPSEAELRELHENCHYIKERVNDVDGLRFISSINGESIFLPLAGMLYPSIEGIGQAGYYRSSFKFTDYSSWYLAIGTTTYSMRVAMWAYNGGQSGMSIRPVISKDLPSMYIKDNAANFGSVRIGTTETRFITIKNTGRTPLNISSIKMSKGNAFTVGMSGCTINPGMLETIPIKFKPSLESGVTDTLRIISNSLNIPEYVLVVSGSGNNQKYTAGEAVDLGLSVKWSSENLGAASPEKLGRTFAWGEFTARTDTEVAYKWFNGYSTEFGGVLKYNIFASNGNIDNKVVLDPEDDAATVNIGSKWRMPTKAEFNELLKNCTWALTDYNGVTGYDVTGPNGNSIFLPFDGNGYYWSASLGDYSMESASMLSISRTSKTVSTNYRSNLFYIRPVEN